MNVKKNRIISNYRESNLFASQCTSQRAAAEFGTTSRCQESRTTVNRPNRYRDAGAFTCSNPFGPSIPENDKNHAGGLPKQPCCPAC